MGLLRTRCFSRTGISRQGCGLEEAAVQPLKVVRAAVDGVDGRTLLAAISS